ncbi:SigB/SigF/SigG family RNA polymerase sigma factor [Jiangella alba]|uniref:RNA polymerase, sigma 37 subunit, RpsB/SigB n=1 Tax=Jiangella alba TaxID=561176 RepID=A0A1H5LG73_9ACTN|nr:SigB/SigF/SigG family RNA polymerase sigma factor [Jiangella alba]SEE75198.1 RNA polymerase, sigma 37 subunit, RpsB/SigB [Jiangella alba]
MQSHAASPDRIQRDHQNRTRARLTKDLLIQAAAARGDERRKLLDEVVILHLNVAAAIARRYDRRGIEHEDLLQVANLGLVGAARRFDPGRGKDFISFAVPTIRGEVKKYFRDHGWAVRPPRRVQEMAAAVSAATQEMSQVNGVAPGAAELADHLGVGVDDVVEASASRECFKTASLDYRGDDGDESAFADTLGKDDDGYTRVDAVAMLAPACRMLKPRDRHIVYLRFFKGLTQQEIGAEFGVTQMQVSRLLARILGSLRNQLRPQGAG